MSFSDPFYSPEYFEYQLEILLLESDDPHEHEQGVDMLIKKAYAGDTDAMMVLGKHFHNGKYRDMSNALKWYIRAAESKHWEGQPRVARLYAHPEDEEPVLAIRQLETEGCGQDRIDEICGMRKKDSGSEG